METTKDYDIVFKRAAEKLSRLLKSFDRSDLLIIAARLDCSYKTIEDYKDKKGKNLRTILSIHETALKYQSEKK